MTSNRDERNNRPAVAPKIYTHNKNRLAYPKDLEKGGTWFALDIIKKKAACLLNASGQHPNLSEKMSRGVIPLKYLLDEKMILSENFLNNIAPFILVCIEFKNKLFLEEYSWDGENLTLKVLNENMPHLWCSNTLYSKAENDRLQKIFSRQVQGITTTKETVDFHKSITQEAENNIFKK